MNKSASRARRATLVCGALCSALAPRIARAEGTPPADAKALVEAPKDVAAAPAVENKLDGTTVTLSAGGMSATGNSRQLAMTANGIFETLFNNNGIGVALLGNYGRGGPPGKPVEATTENLQGRVRYDRYLIDRLSLFLINTGRYDRFQGLDLRYNLDPGVKYLFVREAATSLWGELGYDFQYDVRRDDSRTQLDAAGAPVLVGGQPLLLDKTRTDHSIRTFAGFKHAFNEEVTLSTGLEYLQSMIETERSRLNFDVLFAAKIGGGLALGVGFVARYDNAPLPGKEKLDTATTVSLIYAFSNIVEPKKPPPCPEPAPAPPPAPTPAENPPLPAPAPAPETPPAPTMGEGAPPETIPAPAPDAPPPVPAP
jgi:putative salt-induced outer membrane protein YdiY